MPSFQLQKRLSTKDKIFVKNQEKQIDGQQVVLLVFFNFSRLIQKKSKPTTNGYSINTDHRMRMSTMWNNYRYIPDRTEFYKETLQWGVWTIDRTVKCFRSIAVEVYQCTDFVMDRKLAWTSASRNSTPSLTFSKVTMWRPYIMTRSPEFMFQSQLFLLKKNQEALMVK